MKTKFTISMISISMGLLLAVFVFANNDSKNAPSAASAKDLYASRSTPTPFATSIPGVTAMALRKYANSKITTRVSHGIEISAANFRIENGELMLDICYQTPNNNDWTVAQVTARIGDVEIHPYGGSTFEIVKTLSGGQKRLITYPGNPPLPVSEIIPADSMPADYRCDTMKFHLAPDIVLSSRIIVTISSMASSMEYGKECAYLDLVQGVLDTKGNSIKIDCVQREDGADFPIVEKPGNMNEEAARKQVAKAFGEVFTIQGNWVFEGEVMNMTDPAASVELLATELPIDSAMPPEETVTPTP